MTHNPSSINPYYVLWHDDNNEQVQVIDILKELLTPQEYKGFLKGNILKYRLRAGKKDKFDTIKDIQKAEYYERELAAIEAEESKNENK